MGWKWDVGEKGVGWGEERAGGELKGEEKMGREGKGTKRKERECVKSE